MEALECHTPIKLDIGVDKINRIFHLSDIHIRNVRRHDEYEQVFDKAASYIKSNLQKGDIIFLGGDIVHAKTDMTPELVQSTHKFFSKFADIAPSILITGNHDCNLNNKTRLDALTPIVDALQHKNLHYLKDSGVYEIGGIVFTVMSVFDKPKDYIPAWTVVSNLKKVALFHGAVYNAQTDVGYTLTSRDVTVDTFLGYDFAMLGDIHKPNQTIQSYYLEEGTIFLDDKDTTHVDLMKKGYIVKEYTNKPSSEASIYRKHPCIKYSGSLIQQDHGEGLVHGMLLWDVEKNDAEFIRIDNDYCMYTVDIVNGKFETPDPYIKGKKISLRVRAYDTPVADVKTIIAAFQLKYDIQSVTEQIYNNNRLKDNDNTATDTVNVRDLDVQTSLITKYLEDKFKLDKEFTPVIREINKRINSQVMMTDERRYTQWIPKRFEFSNMFTFGDGNIIDFTNMSGVYGLFAPNASGKSSVFEAITYCIFDKCPRATKAKDVLNNKSDKFYCKFNFKLDDKDYYIEKTGTLQKGNHVKVDIDFYCIENGEKISLNGKERSDTNSNIRNILGMYEDFVLTALSPQHNNSGFIDMPQKDRKDLLSQFLDINIFEKLHEIANNETKEAAALLKDLQKTDYSTQLSQSLQDIEQYSSSLIEYKAQKIQKETAISHINDKIIEQSSKLQECSIQKEVNVPELEENIQIVKHQITLLEVGNTELSAKLPILQQELQDYEEKIELITGAIRDANTTIDELSTLRYNKQQLNTKLASISTSIKSKEVTVSRLDTHQYDPNCKYCVSNPFVQDAMEAKKTILIDYDNKSKLETQLKEFDVKIQELEPIESKIQHANQLFAGVVKDKDNTLNQIKSIDTKILTNTKTIDEYNKAITTALETIRVYKQNLQALENNKVVQQAILDLKSQYSTLNSELSSINDSISNCNTMIAIAEKNKQSAEQAIQRLHDLEIKYKCYSLYLKAVERDGVPYELIASTIPKIQDNINHILSQLVDFQIYLEMDGKNINCYIAYGMDNYWPIELTSGMERFISSIVIRVALISVSSLPRPNFLAIDEGFGSLDSSNLAKMADFFDYLKSQFSILMIISHIDSMKDIVDGILEINKVNGTSSIVYS